jgi:hypothetical protein
VIIEFECERSVSGEEDVGLNGQLSGLPCVRAHMVCIDCDAINSFHGHCSLLKETKLYNRSRDIIPLRPGSQSLVSKENTVKSFNGSGVWKQAQISRRFRSDIFC